MKCFKTEGTVGFHVYGKRRERILVRTVRQTRTDETESSPERPSIAECAVPFACKLQILKHASISTNHL